MLTEAFDCFMECIEFVLIQKLMPAMVTGTNRWTSEDSHKNLMPAEVVVEAVSILIRKHFADNCAYFFTRLVAHDISL